MRSDAAAVPADLPRLPVETKALDAHCIGGLLFSGISGHFAAMNLFDDDDETGRDAVDGPAFAALEREVPLLAKLRGFAEGLDRVPWFTALGEPPSASLKAAAEGYLDRLGFPDAELAILPSWDEAAEAAETAGWASPAWEAEELTRADLTSLALSVMSEEALEIGLRLVAGKAADAAKGSMEEEAAYWDMAEEGPRTLAVGAAVQASHLAALSLLAEAVDPERLAGDSLFAWKFKLFLEGRWPVGVIGGSFNLF